jgi:uncharacterized protein YuzE
MEYRYTGYFENQEMKLNYYPETDSLYIDLVDGPSVESREVSEGVVLDYDAEGNLVGIDIDNASKKLDLTEFTLSRLPAETQTLSR